MNSREIILLLALASATGLWNCGVVQDFNLFSIQDDMQLGKQFSQEIANNPKQYPVLSESNNREAYSYVKGITQKILKSGKVPHANDFAWQVKIINDDKTLNAFAVPGGYLYVYTGLIKYLDSEDQLAGVMGHEIAHAAERHSTEQMTKIYGLDAVRQIITGKQDPGVVEQILLGLSSMKFSRAHETEADESSVLYLCGTSYNAAGAAGFFKKISGKGGNPPEFLSTHPNPGNRIKNIETKAQSLGCRGSQTNKSDYARLKKLL